MMKRITLVQIGVGTVGGAVVEQVIEHRDQWRADFGIDIQIGGIVRRSGAIVNPDGIDATSLRDLVGRRRAGDADGGGQAPAAGAVATLTATGPVIAMDAGAGEETADLDAQVLRAGGGAVLSNKAPLALPMSDDRSQAFWSESRLDGRLRYEATCGAGLPVISTLRNLIDTGDEVLEISGTLSGTFGAIFSDVAAGMPFSEAVRGAKANGYTEPDPRDDLSGLDVARKGLILARTLGERIDLDDINVHSLVPEDLQDVPLAQFLARIDEADVEIGRRAADAVAAATSLKYIVQWERGKQVQVGLRQVPRETVLGSLQGPENIVSFRTVRYDRYPCVVSGPGAGAAVTAAGMVADMLALALRLAS